MAYNKVEYNANYTKNNYDTFNVRVPKGYKEQITDFYKANEYTSMNSYITTLIQNDMDLVNKNMNQLDNDEKYLLNCFRYADEEYRKELIELASKADNAHTSEEKQKLFNLRKFGCELKSKEQWKSISNSDKLPPFYSE